MAEYTLTHVSGKTIKIFTTAIDIDAFQTELDAVTQTYMSEDADGNKTIIGVGIIRNSQVDPVPPPA